MNIKEEDRWRFLNMFNGKLDVFTYQGDTSVGFSPNKAEYPNFGGKDWQSAVDSGIRKYVKNGLFTLT